MMLLSFLSAFIYTFKMCTFAEVAVVGLGARGVFGFVAAAEGFFLLDMILKFFVEYHYEASD